MDVGFKKRAAFKSTPYTFTSKPLQIVYMRPDKGQVDHYIRIEGEKKKKILSIV